MKKKEAWIENGQICIGWPDGLRITPLMDRLRYGSLEELDVMKLTVLNSVCDLDRRTGVETPMSTVFPPKHEIGEVGDLVIAIIQLLRGQGQVR